MFSMGDIAHHDIAHIGIYASAATLSAIKLDVVFTAISQIHLNLDILIAAKDNTRFHLPQEKVVRIVVQIARDVLFGRQIEAKAALSGIRKTDMNHG